MDAGGGGGISGTRHTGKRALLAGASSVALVLGMAGLAPPAQAQVCTPADTTACSAPGGIGGASPRGGDGGAGNGNGGNSSIMVGGNTVPNPGSPGAGGTGGTGGAGDGSGGTGGSVGLSTSSSPPINGAINGSAGGSGPGGFNFASGGGGGGTAVVFSGTSLTIDAAGVLTGGAGGAGGVGSSGPAADAGGGGGGGAGLASTAASASIVNLGAITAGNGGAGGTGGYGGGGGGGGDGILALGGNMTIDNRGSITGGLGGSGGSGPTASGDAGSSGRGVNLVGGGNTLINTGTITGGAENGGGAGIGVVTGGNDIIDNAGTISGGLVSGGTYAASIWFGGTGNRLNLRNGSTLIGDIALDVAAGATIAAQNPGLTLGNRITLGTGSSVTFDTGLANLSVSGNVTGLGSLTVTGGNTLVLSGTNTYAGGTTISDGVLQLGNGGSTGSITGDVVNNRTLAFNRSDAVTFAGAISGGGDVQKLGAGSLTLTGTNTYTGGTLISAGTLIGSATSFGFSQIVNNATLIIDQPTDATFANQINGSGSLAKHGAGVLSLAGTNSYDGGTTISAGTLIGSATSFGSGAITNSAALVIDQVADASFANTISGVGSFAKRGAGNLNLTGTSTFTGQTRVEAGKLSVNGSLGGSAVTVLNGAVLGGSGTVGTTTVQSGATIAPGNSIGTLNVNGNLVLAPGSLYEVEIAGNGTSDRIAATGIATVTGSQVGVTALDPQTSYISGQRYTLITAAGGVNGTVAGAVSRSAFLDLTVDHRPNQVDLVIAVKAAPPVTPPVTPPGPGPTPTPPPAIFETVAQTRNQFATAGGLDTLPQAGGTLALYNSLLMLDAPGARQAFDALSGEIHASAKTALVDESWLLRAAVNDRLRSAFGAVGASPMATLNYGFSADLAPSATGPMPRLRTDRFAVWGQGYGAWGRSDGDRNAAKLTRSTGGFLIGADAAMFDSLRFGVVAGYSRSEFDVNARLSSGESDNYHLGLYGGGQWGALGLRAGASYTWHDIETRRTVAFAGFSDGLKGNYDAGTAQLFGELGYRIELGQTVLGKVALEPFAGLAYVNLHTDGLSETGGAAALTARSDDTSLGYSTLGLRASTTFALQGIDLTLRGGLAWRHAFGDVTPTAKLAFAGSNPFSVAGVPIAKNAAVVEAGLDLALGANATLGASYTGQLAESAQDHAFKANLAVRF